MPHQNAVTKWCHLWCEQRREIPANMMPQSVSSKASGFLSHSWGAFKSLCDFFDGFFWVDFLTRKWQRVASVVFLLVFCYWGIPPCLNWATEKRPMIFCWNLMASRNICWNSTITKEKKWDFRMKNENFIRFSSSLGRKGFWDQKLFFFNALKKIPKMQQAFSWHDVTYYRKEAWTKEYFIIF